MFCTWKKSLTLCKSSGPKLSRQAFAVCYPSGISLNQIEPSRWAWVLSSRRCLLVAEVCRHSPTGSWSRHLWRWCLQYAQLRSSLLRFPGHHSCSDVWQSRCFWNQSTVMTSSDIKISFDLRFIFHQYCVVVSDYLQEIVDQHICLHDVTVIVLEEAEQLVHRRTRRSEVVCAECSFEFVS